MKKKEKEYEILYHYDNDYIDDDIEPLQTVEAAIGDEFQFIGETIKSHNWRLFNLKQVKTNLNSHINYMLLVDEFSYLCSESKERLSYDKEGFYLDGHTFQSLKEVKKALKLKVLL